MNIVELSDHSVDIDLIDDNSVIFDLGAYKGDFLRDLLKYNKKCKVYMYEPNYRITYIKNKYGDLKNVNLIQKAISDKSGRKKFYLGMKSGPGWIKSTGSSLDRSHNYCTDKHINVECTTIVDEIKRLDIKKIDILKMDVEGEELKIIKDLDKNTFDKMDQITVEFHLHSNIDGYTEKEVNKCREILKKNGFKEVKYDNYDSLYIKEDLI